MKTIAVAGPRELGIAAPRVAESIDRYFANAPELYEVLHGNARGVDKLAAAAAKKHGHTPRAFPVIEEDRVKAKAAGTPRKAPLWRTRRMLDEQPLWVIAWWDGHTYGTGFTIGEAGRRGINTFVMPTGPLDTIVLEPLV